MGSRPKSHYILFQVLKQNMYAPHISQIAISLLLRSRLQKAREQLLLHVAQLQQQQQSQSESLVLSRFEEESSRAERTPQFETTSRPRQIRAQGEEKTILAQKIRRKAKKAQVATFCNPNALFSVCGLQRIIRFAFILDVFLSYHERRKMSRAPEPTDSCSSAR